MLVWLVPIASHVHVVAFPKQLVCKGPIYVFRPVMGIPWSKIRNTRRPRVPPAVSNHLSIYDHGYQQLTENKSCKKCEGFQQHPTVCRFINAFWRVSTASNMYSRWYSGSVPSSWSSSAALRSSRKLKNNGGTGAHNSGTCLRAWFQSSSNILFLVIL